MTSERMLRVKATLLDVNPHRRFDINPIDMEQVQHLKRSFSESGDFGVIPVRKVGDRYQIAAGHHRTTAMADLGFEYVDCKVLDLTDTEMLLMMNNENATQHGAKVSHKADSVGATIKELAKWFMLSESVDEFYEKADEVKKDFYGPISTDKERIKAQKVFDRKKEECCRSAAIERVDLHKILSSTLTKESIAIAMSGLEEAGIIVELVAEAEKEVTAIRDEKAARRLLEIEEQERVRIQQEEIARLEAEAARKRAKAAAEAHARAQRAMKAAKERQARVDAERALQRAEAEKKRLAEVAAKKKMQKAKAEAHAAAVEKMRADHALAEQKRKLMAEQLKHQQKESEKNSLLSPEAFRLLGSNTHEKEFIRMVRANPEVYGRDVWDQAGFLRRAAANARAMAPKNAQKDRNKSDMDFMTSAFMVDEMKKENAELQAGIEKAKKEQARRAAESSSERKVDAALKAFFGELSALDKSSKVISDLMNNPETARLVMGHSHSPALIDSLRGLKYFTRKLEDQYNLYVATLGHRDSSVIDVEPRLVGEG